MFCSAEYSQTLCIPILCFAYYSQNLCTHCAEQISVIQNVAGASLPFLLGKGGGAMAATCSYFALGEAAAGFTGGALAAAAAAPQGGKAGGVAAAPSWAERRRRRRGPAPLHVGVALPSEGCTPVQAQSAPACGDGGARCALGASGM